VAPTLDAIAGPDARRRDEERVMARASGMAVRDWMSRRVATVRPDARLGEAARLMGARKIRHLPVVEAAGRLVGIVTARDLRQAVFAPAVQDHLESLAGVLDGLVVRDVMTRGVITARTTTSIRDAARLMHERRLGALPVIDRDRLVGILTETDVLRAFQRLLGARTISP
jgi:acetoin utilization protein AcuB